MRDIKVLKVYNLVNSKGTKIQLRLGILRSRVGELAISNADRGYRWSFNGNEIPMPVRSGYWFNGFEETVMLDWLKGNGWYPHTCVSMDDGKCRVYELPSEPSKGNETYELPIHAIHSGERALKDAVRLLYNNGSRVEAISLYRYVHPSCLLAAHDAIKAIVFDNQQYFCYTK